MKRFGTVFVFMAIALATQADTEAKKVKVFFELGRLNQTQNDIRLPGDTGTPFSFKDFSGSGPFTAGRVTVIYNQTPSRGFRVVIAPLSFSGSKTLTTPIDISGTNFCTGVSTKGSYQFNNYRASYWTKVKTKGPGDWRAGVTLFVRDARITLEQPGKRASFYNLGIAPLFYFGGEYPLSERWSVNVDFDGFVAPQGRVIDASLMLGYKVAKDQQITFGLRVLDGGADNKRVYNFARFQYLTLGWAVQF